MGVNEGAGKYKVELWERPWLMDRLEEVARIHNCPPTTAIKFEGWAKLADLSPFVGKWGPEENDEVSYTITEEGKLLLPEFEGVETVTKNIRFNGSEMSYDVYYYFNRDGEFKTMTNPSGRHPFSGVRCHMTLKMNGQDRNTTIVVCESAGIETISGACERLLGK